MEVTYSTATESARHPVQLEVRPQYEDRNRLTCAFRPILALPHLLLVGGPLALTLSWMTSHDGASTEGGAGAGVLGAVAFVIAIIAWFAIVFTGAFPRGLWMLSAFYLQWRVRAMAYLTLLRDEYPPFGDGAYPAELIVRSPPGARDRVTVAFRLVLVLPQLAALWVIGVAWAATTLIAWAAILVTGRHPAPLYDFAVGALRWTARVEAYVLLLHDEYPPFSLH